jgi:hypothetical protein
MMRRILLLGLVVCLFAFPSNVKADIAPPEQPPGSNPLPGFEPTQVRMVSETVTIEIVASAPKGSLGQAKVTASFTMKNLGSIDESMPVRFPLGVADERSGKARITDLTVKIDGVYVSLNEVTGTDPYYDFGSVPWVEFNAVFPAGRDVNIQVKYTLEAGGESPFTLFSYVFSTGAGWNGTIGSATLFMRFPYEVNEMNVLPSYLADEPNLVSAHKISATELKWTWMDFEPERGDNFKISIVSPPLWQQLLDLDTQVKKTSWDGEAWGRLGKMYKTFAFSSRRRGFRFGNYTDDPGAQQLFHLSVAAYEKAVKLKALDAQWHAGFADLLIYYAYHAGFEGVSTTAQMIRGLDEMNTALHLAPEDPVVLAVAEEDMWYAGEGMAKVGNTYTFPWLTTTPAPTATMIGGDIGTVMPATSTPEPTVTPMAISQPTSTSMFIPSTAANQGKKPLPICGSALLLPLLGGMVLILRKK